MGTQEKVIQEKIEKFTQFLNLLALDSTDYSTKKYLKNIILEDYKKLLLERKNSEP